MHTHVPLIGQVALSAWFTWLVVAILVGSYVATQEARRAGDSPLELLRVAMIGTVAGVVGARLGHLFTASRDVYVADPLALLRFWEGGMVLYGGLVLGVAGCALWIRHRGLRFLRVADAAAPALALGIALGRVGCLSAGCCYGRPIDWGTGVEWPWGTVFLAGVVPEPLRGVALHPTQVYAAVAGIALFLALRALRSRQRFDGQAFAALLMGYPVLRSLNELFRLDLERGFLLPDLFGKTISTSQALSLPVFAAGAVLMVLARRSAEREGTLGLTPRAAHDARLRRRVEQALAA